MEKYQFKLDSDLLKKASQPIRTKHDLIILLINSIKLILTETVDNEKEIPTDEKLIVYVDKMSRLVFCIENKIFSFQFPFIVKPSELEPNKLSILYAPYMQIDSKSSSLLLAVFNRIDIFEGTLETINDKVLEEIIDNEWNDIDIDLFCDLIKFLMLFEPGYLRYDNDEDHENGELHPKNHIDFFYASNNTMKLGLKKEVQEEWFFQMIDITTNCLFIS